ncbi:MAG: tetratricopeptide repeat protein [Sulfurisoma sp.]|nr:tetratricopeptide repeat protein [Sulfurisoma sp.]
MSLLMEALKKAEQAKQAGEGSSDGNDSLRLEPIDSSMATTEPAATTPTGNRLPDLPTQLGVLDAEFMAHAQAAADKRPNKPAAKLGTSSKPAHQAAPATASPAPGRTTEPSHRPAAADGERKAAQQVFAAKQPERSRKGFAIAMGTLTVIALAAIGGYFWWQLQPKSDLATPGIALKASPPAQIAAAPVPPAAVPPAPTFPTTALATPKPAAADDVDDVPPPRRAASRPAPTPAEPESPIRVTKSRLKLNPALTQGFDALNAGDLAAAQADYERVLRTEPRNGDALHGLAAIALRQGNVGRAEEYWLKALESDPKDALAQAALIGSGGRGGADPQAQESRLKTLIAAQPEIAALHFALGNVFARQNRWNEAQQSYFKAFSVEPEHPDYVFNLAVSLDHLRQPRLAAQYYNQALAAAGGKQPVGFDKAQVATRLREINSVPREKD